MARPVNKFDTHSSESIIHQILRRSKKLGYTIKIKKESLVAMAESKFRSYC